jgi:peptide/nickel transport system permease protein
MLAVSSLIIFLLQRVAPGSPEQILVGARPATPELLSNIRDEYGLDEPLPIQFITWLGRAVRGDFGESITHRISVSEVVAGRIVVTLELAALAALLTVTIGLALGAFAAVKRGSWLDGAISGIVIVFSSISGYVSGIVLLLVFSVALGWFPVVGAGEGGWDRLYHLVLPAIALSLAVIALVARTTRSAVISVQRLEFIEAARARGLSERVVLTKHVARNAAIPVMTVSGLAIGYLISGTVLVEYTFGLNGLGSLLVQSISTKDYAVVQALVLIFTAAFIAINLVVDLLYPVVDPRIRMIASSR